MLGAIVGDIVGSEYEFNNGRIYGNEFFTENSTYTDDTVLTVAVMKWLLEENRTADNAVRIFKELCLKHCGRGYGARFARWLTSSDPKPYGSYGNGAAMRISPVAYVAKSKKQLKKLCRVVTGITHNHEEGYKGAEVTAMCVYMALHGKSKKVIRKYVEKHYDINFDFDELVKKYEFNETCQNTVPQAIYCFLESKNFCDCVKKTIEIGGDSDTLAAISCAIAGAYYGMPEGFVVNARERLPQDLKSIIDEFEEKCELSNSKERKRSRNYYFKLSLKLKLYEYKDIIALGAVFGLYALIIFVLSLFATNMSIAIPIIGICIGGFGLIVYIWKMLTKLYIKKRVQSINANYGTREDCDEYIKQKEIIKESTCDDDLDGYYEDFFYDEDDEVKFEEDYESYEPSDDYGVKINRYGDKRDEEDGTKL